MTTKDEQIATQLAMTYADIADALGVSRQSVRQGIVKNQRDDYFSHERLLKIYDYVQREGKQDQQQILAALLATEQQQHQTRYLPLSSVVGHAPNSIIVITPNLRQLQPLIEPLQQLRWKGRLNLQLWCGEAPGAFDFSCRPFRGDLRITLGHCPALARLPLQLLVEDSEGVIRSASCNQSGDVMPLGDPLPPAQHRFWQQSGDASAPSGGSEWVVVRQFDCTPPGRGIPRAHAAAASRSVIDFDLAQLGRYQLIMEQVPEWGWLIRLQQESPTASVHHLQLRDANGEIWLQRRSDQLPAQMIWPDPATDPLTASAEGVYLQPTEEPA